jgi:hypothetical protein
MVCSTLSSLKLQKNIEVKAEKFGWLKAILAFLRRGMYQFIKGLN